MDQLAIVGFGSYMVAKYVVSEFKLLIYFKRLLLMLNNAQVKTRNAATGGGYIHVNQKLR